MPDRRARAPRADHSTRHEAAWSRAKAIAVLDDPGRISREDPRALWELVGLSPGMVVADVGAGSGYYAFPASDRVGPSGRVYAADVSPELVALVRERAREQRRTNVFPVRSRPERVPLPDEVADRVLLANVLHGIPPETVGEAVRLLRPGGQLVDVDWQKRASPDGPPLAHRLSAAAARRALEPYGLRALSTAVLGPSHYVVVLEKPPGPAAPRPRRRRRA